MSRRPCRPDRIGCANDLAIRSPDSGYSHRIHAVIRGLAAAVAIAVAFVSEHALWLVLLLLFPTNKKKIFSLICKLSVRI